MQRTTGIITAATVTLGSMGGVTALAVMQSADDGDESSEGAIEAQLVRDQDDGRSDDDWSAEETTQPVAPATPPSWAPAPVAAARSGGQPVIRERHVYTNTPPSGVAPGETVTAPPPPTPAVPAPPTRANSDDGHDDDDHCDELVHAANNRNEDPDDERDEDEDDERDEDEGDERDQERDEDEDHPAVRK